MTSYVAGVLSGLTVVAAVAAFSYAVGTVLYRKRHRQVARVIGLGRVGDVVHVLVSGLGVRSVTGTDGLKHRLKSDIVDLNELDIANELADFLRGRAASERVVDVMGRFGFNSPHRAYSVIVDSSAKSVALDSKATILIGSGVFNPLVLDLHSSADVARIVDKTDHDDHPLFLSGQGPRIREIYLPGGIDAPFKGRDWTGVGSDGEIEHRDLALIQRIERSTKDGDKSYMVLAGLGAGGTTAAVRYLVDNWDLIAGLSEKCPQGFEVVLGWWSSDFSKTPIPGDIEILHPYHLSDAYRTRLSNSAGHSIIDKHARATFFNSDRKVFFLDFDGVLSEIVEKLDAAEPIDGTRQMLGDLLDSGADVCILSSRPVDYLRKHFDSDEDERLKKLTIIGSKGLARYENGRYVELPIAARWKEHVSDALPRARKAVAAQGLENVEVEGKTLSLSLHYRKNPSAKRAVEALAETIANRYGFILGEGRMVFELEPDASVSKGTAIADRLRSYDWALFAGDDKGDIPGFRVLQQRRDASTTTFCIGVASNEEPEGLRDVTDRMVGGPVALQEFLRSITTSVQSGSGSKLGT